MAAEPQSTEEEAPGTPPPAFKRTDLQRSPSPVSGWEIRQTLVEIPEGIESGRHSHPGPEVGYIVRGVVSMEFDDGTALALRTGDPFLIAPGVIHNARNVGTVTTKMLSTYFVDETVRREARCDRAGVRGLRRLAVAAAGLKLRAV
jgi:quercetin dioxygenase-like cupin family protein